MYLPPLLFRINYFYVQLLPAHSLYCSRISHPRPSLCSLRSLSARPPAGKTAQAVTFLYTLTCTRLGVRPSGGAPSPTSGLLPSSSSSSAPHFASFPRRAAVAASAGTIGDGAVDDSAAAAATAPTVTAATSSSSGGGSRGAAASRLPSSTALAAAAAKVPSDAALASAAFMNRRGPFLVIAPLSTLGHWAKELDNWSVGAGAATKDSHLPHELIALLQASVGGAAPAAVSIGGGTASAASSALQAAAAASSFPDVDVDGDAHVSTASSSASSQQQQQQGPKQAPAGAAPRTSHTFVAAASGAPLNTVVYHGNAPSRAAIREYEFHFTDPATGLTLRPPLGHLGPTGGGGGSAAESFAGAPAALEARVARATSGLFGGATATSSATTSSSSGSGTASSSSSTHSAVRLVPTFKFDVLLTTYEIIIADSSVLSCIPWAAIVVDEAHRLKNATSRLTMELFKFKRDHVVLLTGTPIQNNTEELWPLLHLAAPRAFVPDTAATVAAAASAAVAAAAASAAAAAATATADSAATSSSSSALVVAPPPFSAAAAAAAAAGRLAGGGITKSSFLESYGTLSDAAQVTSLHGLLRPYLLRRLKEDVHTSLPPKQETLIEVELTAVQKQYYRAIYERNTTFLLASAAQGARQSAAVAAAAATMSASGSSNAGGTAAGRKSKADTPSAAASAPAGASVLPSLMNIVMELRKVCNHPYHLRGVEDVLVARAIAGVASTASAEGRPVSPAEIASAVNEQFVGISGKFVLLDKLLPKLRSAGHRVLIFSQMVKTLDLLADYAAYRRYPYERLDGRVRGRERQAAIGALRSVRACVFRVV